MTQNNTLAPATRRAKAKAKAERRQALIDATITTIAEFGLSGTTIARVTGIAGTSIGLANFYFANKEHLLESVLQHPADEESALWQGIDADATLTPTERLVGLVDVRFHPRCCNPKTLAVWFAFWGDAGARDIYRRVIEPKDAERLQATVAIIESLRHPADEQGLNPLQTALGLEAHYDGLWLNHLLYPADFKRLQCRAQALQHLAALFPHHFKSLQITAPGTAAKPANQGS